MVIAGEASGDRLGADLVQSLREELALVEATPTTDYQPLHAGLEPRFFGAGGPALRAAGVDLAFDMTEHSVIGLSDVIRNLVKFRRLLRRLYQLAIEREPDAIICVDFSGFNRRLGHAIKDYARARRDWFHDWDPRLIQYVSPQVWASREGRAAQMARDLDLLISIFPFEKEWYARRVANLPVEFVGHPMLDRYSASPAAPAASPEPARCRRVVLLPGSRAGELARHIPVLIGAIGILRHHFPDLRPQMVLPNETLAERAQTSGLPKDLELRIGRLAETLAEADLAIASTGTVTTECAFFGVPTVALYKTSWVNYHVGRQIVRVKYLAMPNLLAGEELFPEFIQGAATAENVARAAAELLRDSTRRQRIKTRLAEIIAGLGGPGASRRAAQAIVRTMHSRRPQLRRQ